MLFRSAEIRQEGQRGEDALEAGSRLSDWGPLDDYAADARGVSGKDGEREERRVELSVGERLAASGGGQLVGQCASLVSLSIP